MYFLAVAILIVLLAAGYYYQDKWRCGKPLEDDVPRLDHSSRMLAKYEQMFALGTQVSEGITVRNIMTASTKAVSDNESVASLKELMKSIRSHHILVQDDDGHLVGIISDRDLAQRRGRTARQIMTPDPICIDPECNPKRAVGLMVSKRISCLPVVDHFKLCGVITTTDLLLTLEALLQVLEERGSAVSDEQETESIPVLSACGTNGE